MIEFEFESKCKNVLPALLTDAKRAEIDGLTYKQLLSLNRFEPCGSPWFQGEVGTYFLERMKYLRSQPNGHLEHVRASKEIGWDGT